MDPEAAAALARARSPGDDDDRRALGICARNGVDQVERARPIGDHGHTQTGVVARRGIGSEADTRLVAQRVVREDPAVLDHLEERQHEIARDPEDFAGAVVLQALQQGRREHDATWPICRANAIGSGSVLCACALQDP